MRVHLPIDVTPTMYHNWLIERANKMSLQRSTYTILEGLTIKRGIGGDKFGTT